MLEIECAIINFCLHHNTTPSANRSVPSSFVFAKSQNVTFCTMYIYLNLFCQHSFQCLFVLKIDDLFQKQFQSTDTTQMSVVMGIWFMMLTLLLELSVMMATNQYRQSQI